MVSATRVPNNPATFSAIGWDRWTLRRLYATGGDAGLFWDCTDKIEPFTVVVEDCISIGRAFGGGVGNCLSRTDEPITFRRCQLWALDFWGDTSGAYVRVENPEMPNRPDVCFEIKMPKAVALTGYYPTRSCVRYGKEKDEYTVSMEDFVMREASPPEPIPTRQSDGR
jgi:hypothetical protein